MGNEEFSAFYREEMPPLVAFVRKAGFSHEQAADAAQDAMIKALSDWAKLLNPRAWVRTVAYRAAVADAARTKDGQLRAVAGGWATSDHHDQDAAIYGEEHDQLLRDLATLPRCQQLVMTWSLDGFSNIEIADQLDMSPATVRSNLRHARNALKNLFLERARREEA